ncbi:MAG: choice-of-anchor Q domain-containing protein [Lysobacterales bacterium]
MKKHLTPLSGAIALALAGTQPAAASTITVDTLTDNFLVVGDPVCTLRNAIEAATQNSAQAGCIAGESGVVDVIEFDSSLSGGTLTLSQGQLLIFSSLTIEGAATGRRGITVSANDGSRLFFIGNGSSASQVVLRNLTLRDGFVDNEDGGAIRTSADELLIESCTLTDNSASLGDLDLGGRGGALFSTGGQVTIRNSSVSSNSTNRSGGAMGGNNSSLSVIDSNITDNASATGGGIYVSPFSFSVTLSGGTVSNNTAQYSGGGIRSDNTVQATGTTFSGNSAGAEGGAIASFTGNLNLSAITVQGNIADEDGGGIFASGNTNTITESSFTANQAGQRGGAITTGSVMGLYDVNFADNNAGGIGGALFVQSTGNLAMTEGVFENNSAERGGGLFGYGPANLTQTTFVNNTAQTYGGAVYMRNFFNLSQSTVANNSANNGAGIFTAQLGISTLTNVTLSNNTSVLSAFPPYPAAVYAFSAMNIVNSTLLDNAPNGITKANGTDNWTMTNTVIAGSAEADCVDAVTDLDQNLSNLIGDGSCAAGAIDLVVGDPMLGPLASNGGPTQTHAPLSGSPIVDQGNNSDCPSNDQTGMPRPIDGNGDDNAECDIGSVEFVDLFPPLRTLSSAPNVTSPGADSYDLTVTYTDLDGEVDFFSPDIGDITVLPGPLVIQNTSLAGSASALSVTYTLLPPGGTWDFTDGGSYSVTMNADEVRDTATTGANPVSPGSLGQFEVLIAEIDVSGNGQSISDGDDSPASNNGTDLGDVMIGTSGQQTFEIINLGSGSINLTGPVEVVGSNFSVTQPSDTELSEGESTSFQLSFLPAAPGPASAVVNVVNNDADEGLYSFSVTATAVVAQEQIFADGFEDAP